MQTEQASNTSMTELLLPERKLEMEQLTFLDRLGHIDNDKFILERSAKGWTLKKPVSIPVRNILQVGQKSLVEYIFSALVSQRPQLVPWALENQSLVEMANYMLRARSASKMGLYSYTNDVSLYCRRLNTDPDQLITDIKPTGIPELARIEKHRGFLQECVNELQDRKLSPGRMAGYARHIRTFYRVNGIELPKPKFLPKPKIVSKDRAPTPEEVQRVLDVADARGRLLISLPCLAGFREGTISRLEYRHVKDDFEANSTPVHVHVGADEQKGDYCDFDTFLGPEAVQYLRAYLEERKRGSLPRKDSANQPARQKIPPEEIVETSPLIRDSQSPEPRPIGEKQIYKIAHSLFHKAGLGRKNRHGGYELRMHSLRKFFRTQMASLGVESDYIEYFMGHTVDTYHDVQSKGVPFMRNVYANARLSIRPGAWGTKVDLLKQMVKTVGASPEEIQMVLKSLSEPHRVYTGPDQQEEQAVEAFTKLFVDRLSTRLKGSTGFPG